MKISKKHLKKIIREVYQSHTDEPQVGDMVVNTNPNCQHHKSEGMSFRYKIYQILWGSMLLMSVQMMEKIGILETI